MACLLVNCLSVCDFLEWSGNSGNHANEMILMKVLLKEEAIGLISMNV